jgi:branched-chain amino acid transport system permease protein
MLSILNALTLAALYTLLSAGLALIFGLRNVMNFAHGALYMVGAYLGYSVGQAIGFWPALVIVPVVMAAFGAVLEYGLFRPLAKRSVLEMALITYGLSLIIGQVIIEVYGGNTRPLNPPAGLGGSASIFGVQYPTYRLLIIGIGLGAVFGVFAWLRWTRIGLFVRAVSRDRDTARMAGIDTRRLGVLVVCLSTAFAGVAGVLAGPYVAVQPGMGDSIIVISLLIIALGGLGSIGGSIGASAVFAAAATFGAQYLPDVSALLPYILVIAVLIVRPQGLSGMRQGS